MGNSEVEPGLQVLIAPRALGRHDDVARHLSAALFHGASARALQRGLVSLFADTYEQLTLERAGDHVAMEHEAGPAEHLPFGHARLKHPPRYAYVLTPMGADLLPVLQALAAWSTKHIPGRWPSPSWFTEGQPEHFYPDGRRTSA